MKITPEDIRIIEYVFGLDDSDLARILGVNRYTVDRWKKGTPPPLGLATEVMLALYNAARHFNNSDSQRGRAKIIGMKLQMGLGHFIFDGISNL